MHLLTILAIRPSYQMSFFHNFFERFTSVVRSIVAFMLPIAESEAGPVIAAALPYAKDIVANTVFPSGATGVQKRDLAVAQLKSVLASKGVAAAESVGISTLNFVIETALAHLNASAKPSQILPGAPAPHVDPVPAGSQDVLPKK